MTNKKRNNDYYNNGIKINSSINNNFLELQASKLNKIKYNGQKVRIMLITGEKIEGYITDYDVYTILVSNVPYNNSRRNNKNISFDNNNNSNNSNSNDENDKNNENNENNENKDTFSDNIYKSDNALNNINNTRKINQKVIYKTSITYIDIL